jgi:hypothetical protein
VQTLERGALLRNRALECAGGLVLLFFDQGNSFFLLEPSVSWEYTCDPTYLTVGVGPFSSGNPLRTLTRGGHLND